MKYNQVKFAIELIQSYYGLTNPFEIQNKIEEELDMEIHINDILNNLNYEENYETINKEVEYLT